MTMHCVHCNEPLSDRRKKFCNDSCKQKYNYKLKMDKQKKFIKFCEWCDKKIETSIERQRYCCEEHRKLHENQKKREEYIPRKKKPYKVKNIGKIHPYYLSRHSDKPEPEEVIVEK